MKFNRYSLKIETSSDLIKYFTEPTKARYIKKHAKIKTYNITEKDKKFTEKN